MCPFVAFFPSARVSATNASSKAGGRAACLTKKWLAAAASSSLVPPRRASRRARPLGLAGALGPASRMSPASPEVEELVTKHFWVPTESVVFQKRRHINLLELQMVCKELVERACQDGASARLVNLCDSKSCLWGFWKREK